MRGRKSLLALSATIIMLAGCAVGPNYQGPPAVEGGQPAKFKNGMAGGPGHWKAAQPNDKEKRGPWWEIFGDPDLNRLETAAGNANQDLRLAVGRVEEARATSRRAAADFFPNFAFDGRGMRERTSNTLPIQKAQLAGASPFGATGGAGGTSGGSSPLVLSTQPLTTTHNLFNAPVDLNWEVDLFGRVRRSYEASRAETEETIADYQNVALSVAANVAVNYFNLRALDAELDVIDQTLKTRHQALGIAEERLQAGLTGELDVNRERTDLAMVEADRAGVVRVRGEVENALGTLTGQPASTFRLGFHPLNLRVPRIPPGLPSRLLERRPDVAAAERALAAENARIGVAVAAFFPIIRLTGAAGFESASIGDLFNWESRIWQIGPSITLPLFEGGRNVANLRAEQARYGQQVARYRQQVLVAFQDVENSLVDLRGLAAQAQAQERVIAAARRTLELSNGQYRNGAVSFLEVVDAERTSLGSERTATQLLGQRLQATVQLIKALGGGWGSDTPPESMLSSRPHSPAARTDPDMAPAVKSKQGHVRH